MQLQINRKKDIIVEWIPYNQFDIIEEINKGDFATVYSAIWKDGSLQLDQKKWTRKSNIRVNLYKSQNTIKEFLQRVQNFFNL